MVCVDFPLKPYLLSSGFEKNGVASLLGTGSGDGVVAAIATLNTWSFQRAEGFCTLLFHLGEGVSQVSPHFSKTGAITELVMCLHQAKPWLHPHHCVSLAFFEVASRYSTVITLAPELLPPVVDALLGRSVMYQPVS